MSKNLNRNYMFKPCKGTNSEKGVALIMVLGLLTVMVLMAVTFAITMRTERLAAGNYADTVRARELVHVGLARAINQLANDLGTNGLNSHLAGIGVGKVYPDWNVTNLTNSYTNINGTLARWVITNGIVRGEATNYVPRALWDDATNADLTNPSNHWLAVESLIYTNDPSVGPPFESNLMGRVAYIIINCSGLLDANYAGGIPRSIGTNPNEIALGYLGETNASFKTYRDTHVRYETMGELNALADINKPVTNLFVYSRALPACWNNGDITQVNLSGTAADMPAGSARWRAITNAFYLAGFSGSEAGVLYRNLIDYIDPDSVPELLTTSVESVPMINEVVVSNNVTVTTIAGPKYRYVINGAVFIECWFPFITNASQAFNLNSTITFAEAGGVMPDTLTASDASLGTPSAGSFVVIKRDFITKTVELSSIIDPINLVSTVTNLSVKLASPVQAVDQLNSAIVLINQISGLAGSGSGSSLASMECLDPRFNADPADTSLWRQAVSAHTLYGYGLTGTNTWTEWYFSTYTTNCDNNGSMYVANQPLKSVAELGYLVYSSNAPWHTVKLFDSRVLDYFAIGTNNTDVYVAQAQDARRGLVNPNSMQVDALAAVFADMPIDEYPDPDNPSPVRLCMASAMIVAENLYANRYYTNLSDIGMAFTNISQLTNTAGGVITFDNKMKKESLFRNACGLLSVRQNVFTIIIEAQAASGGNIPRNPAKQRAVAIVWRDPYTGEMFVRHIKWLGD